MHTTCHSKACLRYLCTGKIWKWQNWIASFEKYLMISVNTEDIGDMTIVYFEVEDVPYLNTKSTTDFCKLQTCLVFWWNLGSEVLDILFVLRFSLSRFVTFLLIKKVMQDSDISPIKYPAYATQREKNFLNMSLGFSIFQDLEGFDTGIVPAALVDVTSKFFQRLKQYEKMYWSFFGM